MTIFLSLMALVSAILTISAKAKDKEILQFIFKPLTMLAIFLLAFSHSPLPMSFYQKAILAGLILSTIGDVFLIKQDKFFIHGLISFLLGHLCYIAAFLTEPNFPCAFFYLVYVVSFLALLWKFLGKLKLPVIFYALTIAVMSWLALSRFLEINDLKTFSALIGSLFFVTSDSLLALNKFKTPLKYGHFYVLSTYFLAQWLIALSV